LKKRPVYLVLLILMLVTVVAAGVIAAVHFAAPKADAPEPSQSPVSTPEPTPSAAPEPTRTPSPKEQPDAQPDPAAMGTVFERGGTGENVALLQEKLMELYYLPYGTPSGTYDLVTEEAVMLFQQRNALPLTGVADADTVSALFSGEPNYLVGAGMTGPDVALIQGRLAALGYNVIPTGTFDEQTQTAVKAFQNNNSITESGVLNRAAADVLLSASAIDASGSPANHSFVSAAPNAKKTFIDFALSLEGMPRSAAGRGPRYMNSAGFVFYALRRSDIYTKFMSAEDWQNAPYETVSDPAALSEGDILVFDGHVGIYLADGSMLHCSSTTGGVARTEDVMGDPYFADIFICAKRMF